MRPRAPLLPTGRGRSAERRPPDADCGENDGQDLLPVAGTDRTGRLRRVQPSDSIAQAGTLSDCAERVVKSDRKARRQRDGERERMRDRGTERGRDGETGRGDDKFVSAAPSSLSVSPSLYLPVLILGGGF